MYHWQETIGELWERKPQPNIWSYHQTKGLGFYEYFQFCEDINAEPLPVLPAGVPCQNSSTPKGKGQMGGIPMEEMEAYAQEFLNLIEWANGDPKTSPWAAKRAKAGHPKPFNLKMIGVGNEDIIGDVFTERFNFINRRIKAAYPDIQVVGTVGPFNEGSDYEAGWQLAEREQLDIVDEHYYVQPAWFLHNRDFYDKYDRQGTKVYLGEWASWGRTLENALGEALHLTSVERNADVVVMASYAPLFGRNGHTQWNPDLIYFDNTTVQPTVNYYVQQLYGTNSGDEYIYSDLLLTVNGPQSIVNSQKSAIEKRIAHSVVRDTKTGDTIVKLVNCTNLPVAVDVNLDRETAPTYQALITTLTGDAPSHVNHNGSLAPRQTAATLANT
ncbi:MAG: alpha-L-arabinofuranosidase, partial [Prevotella sp.]|nr:alpha-L-arabinofuranosidase [Prevotella sp.]